MLKSTLVALALTLGASSAYAAMMVGGAEMFPAKNIIENAVNSKDHTTLVAAVKAAGLVDTLSGAGPFTVFAPTNEAFAALPAGTVEGLLKPEAKDTLTKILACHVVPAKAMSDGPNAVPLKHMKALLETLVALDAVTKRNGYLEDHFGA